MVRGLTAGFLIILAGALGSCGFQPLYAERPGGRSVSSDLSEVRIAPISDRAGQMLRNELIDRLNPSGEPNPGKYTLIVTLSVSKQELGIRKDETATRANMLLSATFRLVEAESGAIVYRSGSSATTSYNIVESDYGTISAERDARQRGLILLADGIAIRVSAYFNRLRQLRRKQ